MAVTAFIDRLKASQPNGLSSDELGLGGGMNLGFGDADQEVLSASSSSAGDAHLLNPELAQSFLRSLYPKLRRHYDWFRRTQRGQIKQYGRTARSRTEAYRWRGRSATHVLTSGMDDYPRGPPHAGELHLDLISWMAFFTRTMRDIAAYIGESEDEKSFVEIEQAILHNIEGEMIFSYLDLFDEALTTAVDLHWSEEDKMYCDVGVNDDGTYSIISKKFGNSTLTFMPNRRILLRLP